MQNKQCLPVVSLSQYPIHVFCYHHRLHTTCYYFPATNTMYLGCIYFIHQQWPWVFLKHWHVQNPHICYYINADLCGVWQTKCHPQKTIVEQTEGCSQQCFLRDDMLYVTHHTAGQQLFNYFHFDGKSCCQGRHLYIITLESEEYLLIDTISLQIWRKYIQSTFKT